ncbi:MAG TPA: HAD-IC family P-type ATPase [Acidimicrobiia bacterium]|nr:HAD-IC family P-type ATPase [Acidimicrobiia bacterium]
MDDEGHEHRSTTPWHCRSADDVLDALVVDRGGLDPDEVRVRRARFGPNRLRARRGTSAWRVLLGQFESPLIYLLVGALALTLAIEHFSDSVVIGLVLAVNASIGFVQEYKAQTAVESLMELVSSRARVRRRAGEEVVAAEDVVPGDIVVLREGEVVPADVRLLETQGLRVDEATLTGESVPSDKVTDPLDEANLGPADQDNMAFMGTAVTAGDGVGVVVATGLATQIGEISEQVAVGVAPKTPLQTRMEGLARRITVAILGVAVVAFGVGLSFGRSVSQMLLLSVALAVSAVPEGLPIVVTVALAIGVRRMARRNVLVRHLPAVETLGSTTTIMSDKTGTLTQNRMAVGRVVSGGQHFLIDAEARGGGNPRRDGHDVEVEEHPALFDTLLVGMLCNSASQESGDPMELALVEAGERAGMRRYRLARRYPMREKVPFRTERQFMATVHDVPDGEGPGPMVLVKGAPERVAEMCRHQRSADGGVEPVDPAGVHRASEELGAEGFRVLAMAVGRGEEVASSIHDAPSELVFVGLQALVDPPRSSATDAVDRCHDAGIRVVMVTGDHATTASAIAHDVHIDRPARDPDGGDHDRPTAAASTYVATPLETRTGQEIADLSDAELDEALRAVGVFARVTPDQKRRIIERLMGSGEIVAVTGDGVNDAPALHVAHLGAAMGTGTDVAKEASDMVITDDNFASVYAAVEEGRTAFRNIRMATFFLLTSGVGEVLTIVTALMLDWPLPLLPAQILWLNLVTNGVVDVALAFEPGDEALFRRAPRPPREGILDRRLVERLGIVGVWLAVGTLGIFYWHWGIRDEPLLLARTAALTTLVLFQMVHVVNCRSQDLSVFRHNPLANKVLLVGVLASVGIYVGAMYVPWTQELLSLEPMSLSAWIPSVAIALTVLVVNEAHKWLRPARR